MNIWGKIKKKISEEFFWERRIAKNTFLPLEKALRGGHCRLELSYLLPSDETFHDFRRLLLDNVDMMSYEMPIGGEHCQDIGIGFSTSSSSFFMIFRIWNLYSWLIKIFLMQSENFKVFE